MVVNLYYSILDISYKMSELIFHEKRILSEKELVEMKIWRVPKSEDFPDRVKYSFVYVKNKERILGYDNERGKGHHRHYKNEETKIDFKDPETLLNQFKEEIEELKRR